MLSSPRSWAYGLAVGLLSAGARSLLQPVLGDGLPFVLAFPAVLLSALAWGAVPSLITAVVCAAAIALEGAAPATDEPLQIGAFLLSSVVVALIASYFRGSHLRAIRRAAAAEGADQALIDSPLTSWLRTVLIGAVLLPVSIFVVIAWWGYETNRRDAEAASSRASALILEHAQRTFSIALDVANRIGEMTDLPDQQVRQNEAQIQQRLADLATGLPSIVNLNVWDAAGRPLARSDRAVEPDASIADRPYFIEQRDHNPGIGITDVLLGRQTGKELVNLTIRRPSADGSFRGLVAVSMSPTFFREYYQALSREDPRLSTFSLLRIDGTYLARWPPPPDGLPRVPSSSPTLQRLVAGEDAGNLEVEAQRGRERRLVSFRRVPGYPMYVVVGFSRNAMFADWTRFLAILAAIMAPTTAGLFYVSWVALRKTQREQAIANELSEAVRRRSDAERSMLEAQKWETLSVLTGGVAHDFNNLLAIVSTSLHVLRKRHPALVGDRQVDAMSRAIKSGTRLTRQLLSFSRRQALKPETLPLQTWLPAAAELIRSSLGPNVTLNIQIDEDTAPLFVDPAELELALINLSLNSRHALPQGGTIDIRARNHIDTDRPDAPMVCLSVADNGVGIAAHLLPKVREPFFTTRESGSGSGLGLSQVDGLVDQSGGRMSIDSTVGAGTTVRLFFPAGAALPAAPADIDEEPDSMLGGDLLLVEDNDDVSTSTRTLLNRCGVRVVCVSNAAEALGYLAGADKMPDVVLTDIAMPGAMNGIDLALALRKERPQLSVLLTTGYADQIDVAVRAGLEVLPKPVPPEELLRRLRRILPQDQVEQRRA